jgi:purine-nucleoside phosphorylase
MSVRSASSESDAGAAAATIRRRWAGRPRAALVLGTGLHQLSSLVQAEAVIPYADVPHFPRSTALSHCGQLVCGRFGGQIVAVMDGRCHGYEGYPLASLVLPVLTMRELGVEVLILSNASGGLNPDFASGDVVVVSDHINLMFWKQSPPSTTHPRRGSGKTDACGRQPAAPVYDPVLIDQALEISRREGFAAHPGVYAGVTGPNYETRAEYRFLRQIGADVVGMSTVPEAIAAAACGLRTLALSIVTNVARPDHPAVVRAEEVVRAAERAEPNVRKIMAQVVAAPWPARA